MPVSYSLIRVLGEKRAAGGKRKDLRDIANSQMHGAESSRTWLLSIPELRRSPNEQVRDQSQSWSSGHSTGNYGRRWGDRISRRSDIRGDRVTQKITGKGVKANRVENVRRARKITGRKKCLMFSDIGRERPVEHH